MSKEQLKNGERFFHSDLNKLLLCRDHYFNKVYDANDEKMHLDSEIKYYTVDNSSSWHTTNYKFKNDWSEFVVVSSKYDGGSESSRDPYPDAWYVTCMPTNNPNVLIRFHQKTNCYAHTINVVELIQ